MTARGVRECPHGLPSDTCEVCSPSATTVVKRWRPDGAHLYECDERGQFIWRQTIVPGRPGNVSAPCRPIRFFDSAEANLVDGYEYDDLRAHYTDLYHRSKLYRDELNRLREALTAAATALSAVGAHVPADAARTALAAGDEGGV